MLVDDLSMAGLLRRAYFLWDERATATPEGRALEVQGVTKFYGLARKRMAWDLFSDSVAFRSDRWLCTHVNYALLGWLSAWGRRAQVGVLLHAAELDENFTALKRFALRRAGVVLAVSEFTKKKAERLGVGNVHVLPNGVDDPCSGYRAPESAGEEQRILFVGRMDEHYKGQTELLDAMVMLHRRHPRLRLIFVGGGKSIGDWQTEARRKGVEPVVRFAGRVSAAELSQLYATATVFAMPSENEGFGLVYAEAMAHGLPCIGSERDAAREVIAHGVTGLCVPARNATALADAIQTIIRAPSKAREMGQNGRRRFLEHFSRERYRARVLGFMHSWLAASK